MQIKIIKKDCNTFVSSQGGNYGLTNRVQVHCAEKVLLQIFITGLIYNFVTLKYNLLESYLVIKFVITSPFHINAILLKKVSQPTLGVISVYVWFSVGSNCVNISLSFNI